ncbi:MAG TPA: DUF6597 domain-containing transcriptional factor [Mucilaginibacter sp.]|nr:DUF6597 domain-containing transcriptional factor [Mucilaginibacter sp.]
MKNKEYKPCDYLKKYIDAYWALETDAVYRPVARRFFVDCTTEIIINMGTSTPHVNAVSPLQLPGQTKF